MADRNIGLLRRFSPRRRSGAVRRPTLVLLTRYEDNGASSRIRLLQYRSVFSERFDITTQALLSNGYVSAVQRGDRLGKYLRAASGVLRRVLFTLRLVVTRMQFDVTVLEQEYITYLPTRLELVILRLISSGPLVVDVDDANFLRYVDRRGLVDVLCGEKHGALWREASLVVCGSNALMEDVAEVVDGSTQYVVVPSVPPRFEGRRATDRREGNAFRVGWIGSPTTSADLSLLEGPLRRLACRGEIELLVVGASIKAIPGVTTICWPWSPQTEREALESMDVGVMPLYDDEYRRRKCSFKIVQYMGAGIPVVASDVGGNREILCRDGRQAGFVVTTEDEWVHGLEQILVDESVRNDFSRDGLWISDHDLSYRIVAARWSSVLRVIGPSCEDQAPSVDGTRAAS